MARLGRVQERKERTEKRRPGHPERLLTHTYAYLVVVAVPALPPVVPTVAVAVDPLAAVAIVVAVAPVVFVHGILDALLEALNPVGQVARLAGIEPAASALMQ